MGIPVVAQEINSVRGIIDPPSEDVPSTGHFVLCTSAPTGLKEKGVLDQVVWIELRSTGVQGLKKLDRIILIVGPDRDEN